MNLWCFYVYEVSRESATLHYFPILEPALTGTDRWRTGAWQLKERLLWKIIVKIVKNLFRISSHISVLHYLIQTWVINAKAIITTGQYSQQYNVCKTYFYMHNVFYCLLFLGLSPNFNFCYCSFPFIFTPSFLYFTFQFRVSWI